MCGSNKISQFIISKKKANVMKKWEKNDEKLWIIKEFIGWIWSLSVFEWFHSIFSMFTIRKQHTTWSRSQKSPNYTFLSVVSSWNFFLHIFWSLQGAKMSKTKTHHHPKWVKRYAICLTAWLPLPRHADDYEFASGWDGERTKCHK